MPAIFLSWYTYAGKRNASLFSRRVKVILLSLRAIGIYLLILLILGFYIRTEHKEIRKPHFIVAIDNSESVGSILSDPDPADLLTSVAERIQDLCGNSFDVELVNFGEEIRLGDSIHVADQVTSFSMLTEAIDSRFNQSSIGGMLVVTDGIPTAGTSLQNSMMHLAFPVSFLALGDTARERDIRLESVRAPETVYQHSTVPVEILVGRELYPEGLIHLKVLDDQGNVQQDSVLAFGLGEDLRLVKTQIRADSSGIQVWTVQLDPLDAEKNQYNNSKKLIIRVVEEKSKVLLVFDQPHPDIRIYHEILRGQDQIEILLWSLADPWPDLSDVDLILFYQMPEVNRGHQALLESLLTEPVNRLFVVGPQTDLGIMNQLELSENWREEQRGQEDYVARANQSFTLFTLPEGLEGYLKMVPPLRGPLTVSEGRVESHVLFYQTIKGVELDDPLVWFTEENNKKTGYWMGEGIWRWYQYEYLTNEDHFFTDYLIRSITNYLLIKELDERLVVTAPEIVNSRESVRFEARLRNLSGQLITDPAIGLTIEDLAGTSRMYEFRRLQDYYWLELNRMQPGKYRYVASTEESGEVIETEGLLEVIDIPFELLDTRSRFAEMRQVAAQKGGQFFTFAEQEEMNDFLAGLKAERQGWVVEAKWVNVLSILLILLVLVGVFSLEWIIRRYVGAK